MEQIGIRDLKERASEILRRVREEGVSYVVTYHGRVVARLEPEPDEETRRRRGREAVKRLEATRDEIAKHLLPGPSAVELIREGRDRLDAI
jgi:prevent-host-death family protein